MLAARLDTRGRPAADPLVDRVAKIVALIACVGFALAAFWGIAAPFGSGHWAAIAARGIIAENMWQWGILAPVREYVLTQPSQSLYYSHHPWGVFWVTALTYKIFGHHDLICRLPAALMSAACPPLLWAIGRAVWGPVAGALAACGYAVLPIALVFAQFNGFEVSVIFGCLLVTWAYVRFSQTWSLKWLAVSVATLLWSVNTDWEIFVFLGVVLAVTALAGLILPSGWFGTVDTKRLAQWWVIASGIAVLGGVGWLALFRKYGHLEDLLGTHATRSAGNEASLDRVLEARRHWNHLMFTPLGILLGKIAAFVFAIRLVLLRRVLEVFPLAILAMSLFQYLHFKQGADVHIFWPHVFAPYFALSLGVMGHVFERGLSWLLRRILRREFVRVTALSSLGFWMLVPLVMLPDSAAILVYAHHTGLRMNEKGHPIRQDLDKSAALAWMSQRFEGRRVVEIHRSMDYTWAQEWTLRRPLELVTSLPSAGKRGARYFVADARQLAAKDQQRLAETFHVTAVGPFWYIDFEAAKGPFDGYAIVPTRPGFFTRYFKAPTDPVYHVEPDPFRTWELRHHFAHEPNPAPAEPARTADQRRIAHNVAVAAGDMALAERLRSEIVSELDKSMATPLDDGSEILGAFHDQLRHEVWVYIRAAGPTAASQSFTVRSRVLEKKPFSLVSVDEIERRTEGQIEIDSKLWKKDFVYVVQTEIRPRLGREVFEGYFTGTSGASLRPTSGGTRIKLLEID